MMDERTRQELRQISSEEGLWVKYWSQHPHLAHWHAQTAVRQMRDPALSHLVQDALSGEPLITENGVEEGDASNMTVPLDVNDGSIITKDFLFNAGPSNSTEPPEPIVGAPLGSDEAKRGLLAASPTPAKPVALFAALASHLRSQCSNTTDGSVMSSFTLLRFRFRSDKQRAICSFRPRRPPVDAKASTDINPHSILLLNAAIQEALHVSGLTSSWSLLTDEVEAAQRKEESLDGPCIEKSRNSTHVGHVVFTDALLIQGSLLNTMQRIPFHHPLASIRDVFEVFGPCVVKEHSPPSRLMGGSGPEARKAFMQKKSSPAWVVTFTGERPSSILDESDDIVVDPTESARRAADRKHKQRRCRAAEDAAFALYNLQRFLAVDWGLVLTYQSGEPQPSKFERSEGRHDGVVQDHLKGDNSIKRGAHIGGELGRLDGAFVENNNTAAPATRTFPEALIPPVRTHSSCNPPLQSPTALAERHTPLGVPSGEQGQHGHQHHQPSLTTLVVDDAFNGHEDPERRQPTVVGDEVMKVKKKKYVPPTVVYAPPPLHPMPASAPSAVRMCPNDGRCLQINDESHQHAFLHRCTLPQPCPYAHDPRHGPFFVHR